ncbi:Putative mycofactocin system creatinine amidohydrolase family protein MftE [Baekduia alba]|uniref:creatininase family protein n=1 Tax=Baekduia alba TaxID=2997333 RepID=UPI0023419484|nr:creatininase family protein [Baekduia alba]WCB94596.1 Putative mycofactocin system creatinine amidohydrolase family protein MftE [Baekduia alba]
MSAGARSLADLRAPEIADRLSPSSVLLQPVGAIEQHGPHLPLSTDLLIADALAAAVVAARGDELDLWLLPPLAYTKSNEHAWAPGTIWLSPQTMLSVLDDLGRSLATLPAKKLVFLNGHGGNTALLTVANRELRLAHGLMTFLMHPSQPRDSGGAADVHDDELGMGVHAGRDETSVVLHLRPELVDMSVAERSIPNAFAGNARVRFGGDVAFGWAADDLSATGAIGDPTLASAELGATLWAGMIASAAEALAEIAAFAFER